MRIGIMEDREDEFEKNRETAVLYCKSVGYKI